MKEKDELLKVFRTLNLDNQAILLHCAGIVRTAEKAARKAAQGLPTRQNSPQRVKSKKEG
jgi:hypothetical protein